MSARKKIVKEGVIDNASVKNTDTKRLRQNIYRSDIEKLNLFTKMLRRNALYKKALVTHK